MPDRRSYTSEWARTGASDTHYLRDNAPKDETSTESLLAGPDRQLVRQDPTPPDTQPIPNEKLEKRLTHRLNLVSKYLQDDVVIEKLENAKFKDIIILEAILIDKLLALRGHPTSVLRVEDSRKLDEVGTQILAEIKRRGFNVTLTERKAEISAPETTNAAPI